MTNPVDLQSGEAKLKSRQKAFIRYLLLVFLAAMIGGVASGYLTQTYVDDDVGLWLPLGAGFLVVAGLIWFTRDYFNRVDELDLMDNLWAHLYGMYGGLIVFGIWYFLADLGLVEYPIAGAALLVMLLITFAAYGLRKLGLR